MASDEISNDLRILRFENRLKIYRFEVASLFGEVEMLVEDIGDAAAHSCGKISATRSEHQHQAIGHVLAAVIADSLNQGGGAGVANSEAFPSHPVEKRFAARGAVKCNIADQNVLFGSEPGFSW